MAGGRWRLKQRRSFIFIQSHSVESSKLIQNVIIFQLYISSLASLKTFAHLKSAIIRVSFEFQNLKDVGPLRANFDFFSPSVFKIQSVFYYRTSKIEFYSVRALKCHLNEKNLIHGRVNSNDLKI